MAVTRRLVDVNKRLFNMAKASDRERAKEAGYYDGRFRPRTQDTKKQKEKRQSGKNKNWFNDEEI